MMNPLVIMMLIGVVTSEGARRPAADLARHVPGFTWRKARGEQWLYDGDLPVAQFFGGYRAGQRLAGIARPVSLHSLRLIPKGPLFIAKNEGCGPLCLSWRKHLIFYMQIEELKADDSDPRRFRLHLKCRDIGLRNDQPNLAAYRPGNVVEETWLEVSYDPARPSYVFDVRTRLIVQPGRVEAVTARDFGGLEFADLLPAGCNAPLDRKLYHDYVYKSRNGTYYRLPHNKKRTPEKRGILYCRDGTMAFLLEPRGNPVVELVGETGLNTFSEICHAMYDVHFKFSKAKQAELLAAGKPLSVHFRLYAITESAGRRMLQQSIWDPRLDPRDRRTDRVGRRRATAPQRLAPLDPPNYLGPPRFPIAARSTACTHQCSPCPLGR